MVVFHKTGGVSKKKRGVTSAIVHTTPDLHITASLITAGYELENDKMIGAGLKPAVKDPITIGLWLEPAVFWRALITAGLSQEPTMVGLYHCWFLPRTNGDKPTTQKAAAILSFLFSSILRTEACVWTLPSIVAAALHHDASAWILKNGLIFLL